MNHPTEEQLIQHYYSEADDLATVEQHQGSCEPCRAAYDSLRRTMERVDAFSVPDLDPGFEARVWTRLQPALPVARRFHLWPPDFRWALAASAAVVLLVTAFLAGRYSRPAPEMARASSSSERALQVAIGDHLERSQIVLTELANSDAAEPLDISFEQQRAADLLDENRLYRLSATRAGDAVVAGVLDDLERILVEIEHAPSNISPADLDELRLRLRADGLLFKLRVLGSTVQARPEPARKPL